MGQVLKLLSRFKDEERETLSLSNLHDHTLKEASNSSPCKTEAQYLYLPILPPIPTDFSPWKCCFDKFKTTNVHLLPC